MTSGGSSQPPLHRPSRIPPLLERIEHPMGFGRPGQGNDKVDDGTKVVLDPAA
jgi:hypothetical protein